MEEYGFTIDCPQCGDIIYVECEEGEIVDAVCDCCGYSEECSYKELIQWELEP